MTNMIAGVLSEGKAYSGFQLIACMNINHVRRIVTNLAL